MIIPTPGRVVHFTPRGDDPQFSGSYASPFAAHVAYVWGDRCVNLMVIHPDGHTLAYTSVDLLQDDDLPTSDRPYCQWMEYQKGQAARTEAAEAKVA